MLSCLLLATVPYLACPLFPYTTLFRSLGGRLGLDVSGFYMEMNNLVVPQSENGVPGLANAGTVFFRGGEMELDWRIRSEEHTSELQSLRHLVCRLLLEKKKTKDSHGAT